MFRFTFRKPATNTVVSAQLPDTAVTGWQCDTHPGRPAVTHFFTGDGGHGWVCLECVPEDYVSLNDDPSCCFWSHTHRRLQPIAILNTSVLTADGQFELATITAEQARALIAGQETLSAVGHDSTAQILTELLGVEVPVNRINFSQEVGQVALVFKLMGRPPEGQILSATDIEEIGYDFKVLTRLS